MPHPDQATQETETLRVLAGGVAHDFNNLLTAIMGNADLGGYVAAAGGDAAPFFLAIQKAAERAAELTRQLLAYAGRGASQVLPLDLNRVVADFRQAAVGELPAQVRVQCDLADRLPFIKGDAGQIFQVLASLLANAGEACADQAEARIQVCTRAERVTAAGAEGGSWVLPIQPGAYATLEVADDGVGMTPEVLARAFEPFYSTRFLGRGMGLAAVLGILRSHGGGLRVHTAPGRGSAFKIYFPAMREPRARRVPEHLPAWRGEGRLLVVDADPAARRVAGDLARHLGFAVLEAEDAAQAVRRLRQHRNGLALVLLDLDLPGPGGGQALRELRALDAKVPVLLTTGYAGTSPEPPSQGPVAILKKPYRAAEFQAEVQRALAARSH